MSNYEKRLAHNGRRTDRAVSVFERLNDEFTDAARDDRELFDEIQVEIDRLAGLQQIAQTRGRRNEHRAKRVRELFL